MAQIGFTDKVAINTNPDIPDINKVTDADMNEIKSVVNTNDDILGTITNAYNAKEVSSSTELEIVSINLQAGHTYIVTASADIGDNINSIMNLQMYIKSGLTVSNYIPRNSRTIGNAGGGICITGFFQCQTDCVIGCSCYNYDSSSHTYRCYIGAIQLK